MESEAFIESPCVRICTLDRDGTCLGCFRTVGEIAAWGSASSGERLAVLEACRARRHARGAPPAPDPGPD